jgi:hypothetical protein
LEVIQNSVDKDELHVQATSETPEVILNKNEGQIFFKGRSMPDDAKSFYMPLVGWILKYSEHPTPGTRAVFDYEYFNTSSSKMIMEIMMALLEVQERDKQFKAEWHYFQDDDDILEAGEDYEEMTGIKLEYISHE